MNITEQQDLVHQTREARRGVDFPKLSPSERDALIKKYHPDHRAHAYRPIKFGPNAGESTVTEVAMLLEGDSPIPADFDLTPEYSVDVLVVVAAGQVVRQHSMHMLQVQMSCWPQSYG